MRVFIEISLVQIFKRLLEYWILGLSSRDAQVSREGLLLLLRRG